MDIFPSPELQQMRLNRSVKTFGFLIGLLGLYMMGLGALSVFDAVRSHWWPIAEGLVEQSGVERIPDTNRFRPVVRYAYKEGRMPRTGTAFFHPSNNSARFDRKTAFKLAAAFPADSRIEVRYDPGDPTVSLLRPGVGKGSFAGLVSGFLFAFFGINLFIHAIRHRVDEEVNVGAPKMFIFFAGVALWLWLTR